MRALILIDYIHLDNALFMKSLAQEIGRINDKHEVMLIHGTSPYQERLKAAGYEHNKARLRSSKELNRRMIALLADEGVAAVGIHAFQRSLFSRDNKSKQLMVNTETLKTMNLTSTLVLSNVGQIREDSYDLLSISEMAEALLRQTDYEYCFTFPATEKMNVDLPDKLDQASRLNLLPEELLDYECDARMINVKDISKLDNFSVSAEI
jgi:hypothetical protein